MKSLEDAFEYMSRSAKTEGIEQLAVELVKKEILINFSEYSTKDCFLKTSKVIQCLPAD